MVMQKLDVSWAGAQKFVRSSKVFIANKKGAGGILDEDAFVLKEIAYKIKDGDILCIDDKLLDEQKEKKRISKKSELKSSARRNADKQIVGTMSTRKFEEMITYENKNILIIDKPSGVPC